MVTGSIPADHPRAASLRTREALRRAVDAGLVHPTGLIAHGRGEAFDYLLGERTHDFSDEAAAVAAGVLGGADRPVVSVNGNVVALAARACVSLADAVGAIIEVNVFHRTTKRVAALADAMRDSGAENVLGEHATARIPGLRSDRALCADEGIFAADVVLVPLEDGDRCQALVAMGKTVLTIDLNPLSRTARTAHVTVVDELTRALPRIEHHARASTSRPLDGWDNAGALQRARAAMCPPTIGPPARKP